METGVDFIAADLPQANRLTVHIMAAMAEHEREMISERTQAGMDAARREIALNGFRMSKTGRKFSTFGNPRWWESIAKARAANLPAPPPA
jgi:DNA invertase Pin-like site-specific DNA recombinase